MRPIRAMFLMSFVCVLALPAMAGEPATAVVERTDFRCEVAAEGRVAPGTITEVRLSLRNWRGRTVLLSAIEPGLVVREGQVVMSLDDRDIEKALDDARYALSVAEREFAAQMERLRMKADGAELELAGKRREFEVARDALANFLEVTLPRSAERAERDAKSYARSVENARDELDQLEQMYAEDELVDETEEIVLKRARWDLENRLANQQTRQEQRDFEVRFTEKDQQRALELSLRQRQYGLERAEMEFALDRIARQMEAEKALRSIEERRDNVADLAADLSDFTLRAPCAGILLHGDRVGSLDRELKRGDQVAPESVAFIIAAPDGLQADLSVPAEEILRVGVGLAVFMRISATGQGEVPGAVATRSILPRGGRIPFTAVPESPLDPALLGISVKGRVVISELEDVLVIPLTAVLREGGRALCRRPLDGGGTRLVPVILGPDDGKRVVVVEGLEEGDEILVGESKE